MASNNESKPNKGNELVPESVRVQFKYAEDVLLEKERLSIVDLPSIGEEFYLRSYRYRVMNILHNLDENTITVYLGLV